MSWLGLVALVCLAVVAVIIALAAWLDGKEGGGSRR